MEPLCQPHDAGPDALQNVCTARPRHLGKIIDEVGPPSPRSAPTKNIGRYPSMSSADFDFAPLLPAGLPAPAAKWTGLAKYSFVGGNNDPKQVPIEGLIDAVNAVLRREGRTLATFAPALRVGFIKLYQAALKAGVAITRDRNGR